MRKRTGLFMAVAAIVAAMLAPGATSASSGWYITNYPTTRTFTVPIPGLGGCTPYIWDAEWFYPDTFGSTSTTDEADMTSTMKLCDPGPPGLFAGATKGFQAKLSLVNSQVTYSSGIAFSGSSGCYLAAGCSIETWGNATWTYGGVSRSHYPRLDFKFTLTSTNVSINVTIRDGASPPAGTYYYLRYDS